MQFVVSKYRFELTSIAIYSFQQKGSWIYFKGICEGFTEVQNVYFSIDVVGGPFNPCGPRRGNGTVDTPCIRPYLCGAHVYHRIDMTQLKACTGLIRGEGGVITLISFGPYYLLIRW